jgi:hypothetical protein
MTWVQFEVTGVTGRPVTLGVKVKLEVVECWVGGLVVILDRDAFTTWLSAPRAPFTRQEITFEPDTADPCGLAVSFDGRVQRSVLTAADVTRLTTAIALEPPPVDVSSAFTTAGAGTRSSTAAGRAS